MKTLAAGAIPGVSYGKPLDVFRIRQTFDEARTDDHHDEPCNLIVQSTSIPIALQIGSEPE